MGPSAAWFYEGQLRLHRDNNDADCFKLRSSLVAVRKVIVWIEDLLTFFRRQLFWDPIPSFWARAPEILRRND